MSTPQVRSRELLTLEGYLVATVESPKEFPDRKHPVPCRACGHRKMIRIKTDLFNAFDIIGFHPLTREVLLVQVTSAAHHAERKNKILASMEAKLVLLAGCRVMIHSWKKDERHNRWVIREEEITLKDYAHAPHYPNDVQSLREIKAKEKKPDLPPGATLQFAPICDEDMPF